MPITDSGGGTRPWQSEVRMDWDVRIPMRDGVHLSGILYTKRDATAAAPAIFMMTPYIAQTAHDVAVFFAAHGYAFLAVDIRGRGNSEGSFKVDGSDARDAYDVIEWLAGQPHCDGKVAGWGGSYSGYIQWAAAKEFPPHLSTIAPAASPFRGVDSPAPNNIFTTYRAQWLTLLAGRTAQDKVFADQPFWNAQFLRWFESGQPFRELDRFVGHHSPIFQEWLSHPRRDDYWDSFNPSVQQYGEIALPILTITGMYDTNQIGALEHYRQHVAYASAHARARHYLLIGPWDHAGTRAPKAHFGGLTVAPAALLDLCQLHLEWYDWVIRGGRKPAFLRKNVAYYVMGAEEWRYADTLQDATAAAQPLYLRSSGNPRSVAEAGGLTVESVAGGGPDWYTYDPGNVDLAELESTTDPADCADQRMMHASAGRHLVYQSAPLPGSVELIGFFRLIVWLSIDQPDTDFRATVYEVAQDGGAIRLTAASMRARHRADLRQERLIETTQPLRYQFEGFTFVARRLAAGAHLRLVIGALDSIFWQKNYNSGRPVSDESRDDARPVTVKLFHDSAHRSALYVPRARGPGQLSREGGHGN